MAAWLAFLKSRLLLPPEPGEAGPSAEDLAAHLAFQLERLSAMREAAARLMARDQLGRDFFARGVPEDIVRHTKVSYEATLLDLMRAYAPVSYTHLDVYKRQGIRAMTIPAFALFKRAMRQHPLRKLRLHAPRGL